MDNLRLFYELLHKYERKQNYDNEYKALFRPMIVDAIPDIISLDLVFKIVDIHQFNINMFAIHSDNNFKTTEDVKAFLKEENYNFDNDCLDFIEIYTKRGYFINFEINSESDLNNFRIDYMPRFSYIGEDNNE